MTLLKRYRRSIRSNLAFYISTAVLTMVTLVLFYLFYIGGTGINRFGDEFFASQNLEDAHFTTYLPISEEELENLEDEYHVVLEAQSSIDVEEDDTAADAGSADGISAETNADTGVDTNVSTCARVFSVTEKINLYAVTAGSDLSSDTDIIISEGYALNMGVEIGDTVTLAGKEFTVAGYFQRPDYLYMLQEEDDSYKNISTFYLAYVTEDAFEALESVSSSTAVTYLVQYQRDNSIDFRKAVNETYYMQNYLSADDNMRILVVHQQADMFIVMAYLILVLMPLAAVVLVCIMISRKVKEEQRLIGTLSAFGYSNGKIILHYAVFAAIPGLLAGVLSFAAAGLFAQTYGEMCLSDYEPLHITFSLPLGIGLLGIVIPTVMYLAAGMLATSSLLKNDTVDMLNQKAGGKDHLKTIFRKSRFSFRAKLAMRSMIGSPARAFAVTLGVFLGSVIILVSLAMIDTIDHVSTQSVSDLGSFEYEYIFNSLQSGEPEDGAAMVISTFEHTSGTRLTFMGMDDNPYLNLTTENGEAVTHTDGWYLSTAAAAALSAEAGDELTFYNPLTMEEMTVTVNGIVDYDISAAMFTSLDNMTALLDMEKGTYNAVMSDTALKFEDGLVRKTIRKSSIVAQMDTILEEMGPIFYACVILGIIICIAGIYAVVNMMIGENRTNISMLKVLGYPDKRINRIILSANHILLPFGILLSIPVAFAVMDVFWKMLLDYDVMLITTYVSPASFCMTILFVSACYFGSVWMVGRKTLKVSMEESLKGQRE